MSYGWRKCFLCHGYGKVTIGRNFSISLNLEQKDVKCPICNGRGNIATKNFPMNPWEKTRGKINE